MFQSVCHIDEVLMFLYGLLSLKSACHHCQSLRTDAEYIKREGLDLKMG